MTVKEEPTTYRTEDGRKFTSRKEAERHDALAAALDERPTSQLSRLPIEEVRAEPSATMTGPAVWSKFNEFTRCWTGRDEDGALWVAVPVP